MPGESYGRRSLVGYSSKGHTELDTTETTSHTQTEAHIPSVASYHLCVLKAHKYAMFLLQVHVHLQIHRERCGRIHTKLKTVDTFWKGAEVGVVAKRTIAFSVIF